jgi:hypothetical protein
MTATLTCPACAAASPDGGLCHGCCDKLEAALKAIDWLWGDLEAVVAKILKLERAGKGTPAIAHCPINLRAMDMRDLAHAHIVGWCRILEEEAGVALPAVTATKYLIQHLIRHVPRLRMLDAAKETLDGMEGLADNIKRTVDRPPDRISLGACPVCGRLRMADADARVYTCACGAGETAQSAHAARQTRADDALVTRAQAEWALRTHIPKQTVSTWVSRRRLAVAGVAKTTGGLAHLYRFGDLKGLIGRGRYGDTHD